MKMSYLYRDKGVTVKRATQVLFVLVSVMAPVWAYALGLGEIKLRSALEEPFDAEIELSDASSSVLKSLQVKLADPEDFSRVGIKPVAAIKLLDFKVVEKPGGGAAVRITTQEPIHDPYLNFLVEANWGRGRALREYTVLLDPPELAGEDAPVIEAPVVETAQPEPVIEPDVLPAEVPPVAAVTAQPELPSVTEEVIDETLVELGLPPVDDEGLIEPGFVELEPLPEVAGADVAGPGLPPVDDEGLIEPEVIDPEPLPDVAEAEPELPPVGEEGLMEAESAAQAPFEAELPLAETEPAPEAETGQQAMLDLDDVTVASEAEAAPLSYAVERGDTLWSIAEQMRGDSSASVYQVMMALFHNNRHAFIGDNVNNLKAGTVLRIEDEGELTAVSSVAARNEFWQQHRAWQDYKQMLAENVVTQTDTLPEAGPDVVLSDKIYTAEEVAHLAEASKAVQEQVQAGAQLKLVSPEEVTPPAPAPESDTTAGTATGDSAASDSLAQLQKMREEVLAEIDKSEQGSAQNQALREKLTALEEQIASLQRVVSVKDTELAAMQQKAAEQVQEPLVQVETETAPVEETGLMARLNRSPQLMGILGGAVLLLLAWLWLMFRRRKGGDAPEPAVAAEAGGFSNAGAGYNVDQGAEDGTLARVDDLVEQGNHAAAVDLLNEAIQQSPENEDYRYRLLEILHEMKNKDAFAHEAEELYGLSGGQDAARWGKVVAMGAALLPAHALFSAASPDVADASGIDEFLTETEEAAASEWDDMELADEVEEFDASESSAEDEADQIIGEVLGEGGGDQVADSSGSEQQGADWNAEFEMEDEELSETFSLEEELLDDASEEAGDEDTGIDFNLPGKESVAKAAAAAGGAAAGAAGAVAAAGGDILEFTRRGDDEDKVSDPADEQPPESEEAEELLVEDDPLQSGPEQLADDAAVEEGLDLVEDGVEEYTDASVPSFSEYDAMSEDEDLLDDVDEIGTKLDLARAYIDMGDSEAAQSMLDEVKQDGDDVQKQEADELLKQLSG